MGKEVEPFGKWWRGLAEFSRGGEAEGLGGPSVGSERPNLEVCKQDEPPR